MGTAASPSIRWRRSPAWSTQAPTYQVADAAGQKARATITPTVAAPPAPSANPDTQVVAPVSAGGTGTVAFDPLLGAGGLASGAGNPTVCLIDPSTGLCAGGNSVTIAGAGAYVLDPTTKIVTFTLDAGVTSAGSLPAATYQVTDSFGQTATATLTPVIPTPPTGGPTYTRDEIIAIIYAAADAYGQSRVDMLRVATCESNLDPYNVTPPYSASGLFQFLPGTWATTPYKDQSIFDPVANANAAAWMWSVGRRNEWVCK